MEPGYLTHLVSICLLRLLCDLRTDVQRGSADRWPNIESSSLCFSFSSSNKTEMRLKNLAKQEVDEIKPTKGQQWVTSGSRRELGDIS